LSEPASEQPIGTISHRRDVRGVYTHLRRRLRVQLRAPSDAVHNERTMYLEGAFQAVSNAGAMSFVSVFLVRLGAPTWLVGIYTALPALVTIMAVLPMGSYVQHTRNLKATLNWTRFIFRGLFGSFGLLTYLPVTIAPYFLVGLRSLAAIPGAALNVAGTTLLGKATTPERRPGMLSTRSAIIGLFSAALGLLFGQWLSAAPYPLNYQLLFASAFVAGLGSIWAISRLRLLETPTVSAVARRKIGLREMLPLIRETAAFRNYAIAALVFRLGMDMPMALFPIYRVRTLGSTDAWIGVLLTVERLLSVVSYMVLGCLLRKPQFQRWLWLGCLGMPLFPLTTALARTPEMLLVPEVLAGLIAPIMNVFMTNTLYQVSPEDQRPTFVAADSFLANIMAFAAPLLGTFLADAADIRVALIVIAIIRVVGGLSFWHLGVGIERPEGAAL